MSVLAKFVLFYICNDMSSSVIICLLIDLDLNKDKFIEYCIVLAEMVIGMAQFENFKFLNICQITNVYDTYKFREFEPWCGVSIDRLRLLCDTDENFESIHLSNILFS